MTPLLVANWKMNVRDGEAVAIARAIVAAPPTHVALVLCPSFTAIASVAAVLRGTVIGLGAQDIASEYDGAFTGEVSALDLAALGCTSVIVGHSERRQRFGETDVCIAQKLRTALAIHLRPILCVGETWEERQRGQRAAVLLQQLSDALQGVALIGAQELHIAYEPVWAIGTGHPATPEDAAQAHAYIRDVIGELLGRGVVETHVRVLYGGSVNPENVATFLVQPGVDGALVGSASQGVDRLANLLHACA